MERKFNEELIKRLRKGEIVIHNPNRRFSFELDDILKYAFPEDSSQLGGGNLYYRSGYNHNKIWVGVSDTDGLAIVSIDDFFVNQNTEVNNYEIF